MVHTKKEVGRNARIQALVFENDNRGTITYFKGIGYNFIFQLILFVHNIFPS